MRADGKSLDRPIATPGDHDSLVARVVDYLRASRATIDDASGGDTANASQAVAFSAEDKAVLRKVLVGHDAMRMRGYSTSAVYAAFIRLLMRVRDGIELRYEAGKTGWRPMLKLVNVVAYGFRSLPRIVLPKLESLHVRWFPGRAPERRIRSAAYARGLPLDPLLDVVPALPQSPSNYAYINDRSRNIVVGTMVGADVIRCGDRWAVIETNTGSGQNDQWKVVSDANPFIDNMVGFAREHGFENLVVINNDRGLHPSQDRYYSEAATRNGVDVRIIEPSSVPGTRHPRSSIVPPLDEPNTLCVRIRDFPCWADAIISDKRHARHALNDYFDGHDVANVFTPDSSPGWLDRVNWNSGPYPNLVAKIPDADKGIGIAFYKARSKAHALELVASQGRSDFRIGGLQGALARSAKSAERMLEAFVPSDLSPEGRLFKYRVNLLVTPIGHTMLSSTIVTAAKPVPPTLSPGLVTDPYPFIANAFDGSLRATPGPDELRSLAAAAGEIGNALGRRLERQFSLDIGYPQ